MRMGIIEENYDSKLYKYLERNNLVDYVDEREWSDNLLEYGKFQKFKTIPKKYLIDSEYWKKALAHKNNLILFSYKSLERTPNFFSTSAEHGTIKFFGPRFFNYLYQAFYGFLHKNLSFLVFIHFLLVILLIKKNKVYQKTTPFLIPISFLVLSFAITSSIFSYQDSTFLRTRSGINPIIIFMYIYPICYFISNYKFYLKKWFSL